MKSNFLHLTTVWAMALCLSLISCNSNNGSNSIVAGTGSANDVAVTGTVDDIGSVYVQLDGKFNLDPISLTLSDVKVGVEVSENREFKPSRFCRATVVGETSFSVKVMELRPQTTYYYCTSVIDSERGRTYVGRVQSFTTAEKSLGRIVPIDLGLSVRWASCNVGAEIPEDYGNYYAWGEIVGYDEADENNKKNYAYNTQTSYVKTYYNWSTYKYCDGNSTTLTKYCTKDDFGIVDEKLTLELMDDAAHINMGGRWRMPTHTEWSELQAHCRWDWITQNGVKGCKVTGPNGNSIFLPACGYRYESGVTHVGVDGYYWSSTLDGSYPNRAWRARFNDENVGMMSRYRNDGRPIRAVCP